MVEWKQKNTFVKLNFPVIESREEMIALGIRSNETLIIFNCFIWICTLVCIPMKHERGLDGFYEFFMGGRYSNRRLMQLMRLWGCSVINRSEF